MHAAGQPRVQRSPPRLGSAAAAPSRPRRRRARSASRARGRRRRRPRSGAAGRRGRGRSRESISRIRSAPSVERRGEARPGRRARAPACAARCSTSTASSSRARRSAIRPVPSGELSSTIRIGRHRPAARPAAAATARDDRLEVLRLVVGRAGSARRPATGAYPSRACGTPRSRSPSRSSPTCTSWTARSSTASSPTATRPRRSARRACRSPRCARQGRVDGAAGIGKTIAEKIDALLETGSIPVGREAEGEVSRPGSSRSRASRGSGPKRARLLYEHLGIDVARRAAQGGRGAAASSDVPGFGKKAEENILAGARRRRGRRAQAALLLSKALQVARGAASTRCASTRPRARRDRGQRAPLGRRPSRTSTSWPRPATRAALVEAFCSLAADRRGRRRPARRARARSRTTGCRSTCASSPEEASATCSSTSPARAAQRGAAHRGGQARPPRERVRHRRRRQRRRRSPARPRRRSTSCSAWSGSRRSCARTAASSTAAREARAAASWSSWATSAATCTATPRPPTAATSIEEMAEAARERGYEYIAITDHSAIARLRQRRAARRAAAQVEHIRGARARGDPRARRIRGQHPAPTARSTTRTTLLERAGLGHGQPAHVVPDLREGEDRAHDRARWSTRSST